jgi:hypothetical protein
MLLRGCDYCLRCPVSLWCVNHKVVPWHYWCWSLQVTFVYALQAGASLLSEDYPPPPTWSHSCVQRCSPGYPHPDCTAFVRLSEQLQRRQEGGNR